MAAQNPGVCRNSQPGFAPILRGLGRFHLVWFTNHGSTLGYEPNDQGEWAEQPDFREPPLALDGTADNWNFREDDADYFSQPGALFRLMSPAQQQILFDNTARSVGDAPREIQLRHVRHCLKADPAYGQGVAKALGIPSNEIV